MLRPYQESCLDQIESHWRQGINRLCVAMATGSGKTNVMVELIRRTTGRVLVTVHGRALVHNMSDRLGDLDHSVFMSGDRRYDPLKRIQVASIDTINSRGEFTEADHICVDELHQASSERYKDFAWMCPDAKITGFTATPYLDKSLRHIADAIIEPITINELVQQGYLVPPVYYAKHPPDLSKVSIVAGEYNQTQLDEAMMKTQVYGDAILEWKQLGQDRPTLGFCTSVKSSKAMCAAFNADGIPSEHMDAMTDDDDRRAILERSKKGITKIVFNVAVLTVGVDMPWISCIIDLAPTLSLIRNDQKLGRGTRPFPGKSDFIVLDHGSNVFSHGSILDKRIATIDGDITRPKGKALISVCKRCFGVFPATISTCPYCHAEQPSPIGRTMKVEDGRLVPITEEDRRSPTENAMILARKLDYVAKRRGLHPGWIFHSVKKKYGQRIAEQVCGSSNSRR